jgi:galactose mutarotase-like enzyme
MFHSIHSSALKVSVKQIGIELCSIQSKKTGREYIWQANPRFWGSHAPLLFPIIGALKNGETMLQGLPRKIPKHGLVRNSTKPTVIGQTEESIIFQFHWDDETFKSFPFRFVLEVRFQLQENRLHLHHSVRNVDTQSFSFNLGGHPAFNCPLTEDEAYSDYSLLFEQAETASTILLDECGLLTDKQMPMLDNVRELPLRNDLFDQDALIFKDLISREVTLQSKNLGPVLSVRFPDFPYLGIWAKPRAPFLCIEPWHGVTDHASSNGRFLDKEKLISLDPGEQKNLTYSIDIHE